MKLCRNCFMFLLIFIISIPLIKCALTPEEEAEAQKEAKIVVKEIKRLIKSKNPEDKKTAYQMYSVLMYDNDEDKKCFMDNIAKELAEAEKKLEKSKIMGFVAQIILSRQQVMIDFFKHYLGKKRPKRSKKSKTRKNNKKFKENDKKPKRKGSKYWKKFIALVKPPLKLKKKPLKELKKCFEELTKTKPKIKKPGFIISKKSIIANLGKDSKKKKPKSKSRFLK